MILLVIEENEDRKIEQVKDGDDYLEFISFYTGRWLATSGNVSGISFLSKDGIHWCKCGSGKLRTAVLNKVENMNRFFRKGE